MPVDRARVPAVGRSSVPIRCSIVDLPEPDGPTMATSSPCADASGDTSRSAVTPPGYTLVTPSSSTTASVMRGIPTVSALGEAVAGDLDPAVGEQPGLTAT